MSNTRLILGDCLDVMRRIESASFDCIITSPPFNLGNGHHTGNIRHKPYDDDMPESEYQAWQLEVLAEMYRLLTDDGSVFYQHKNRIKAGRTITPYEWLLKSEFVIKQELVWRNGSQNFDKIRFYPQTERVYWLAKSSDTQIYNSINATDYFEWLPVGTGGDHTRAFPIDFPKQMLAVLKDAKSVLDPFAGSGTTLVAAQLMGVDAYGIEIDPTYYAIAEKRIAQAQLQIRMEI